MTEQRRRQIRAELARRMGYFVAALNRRYGLQSASKIIYTRWRETENEAWMDAPDPFTDAADKDELVKWLAAQPSEMQMAFERDLLDSLCENDDGRTVALFWLTAPLETITLAAAKALGIGEAGE